MTISGGQVVPIILEQPDTTDKTRAFRVDTGELLQDSNGAAVMIDPTTTTVVRRKRHAAKKDTADIGSFKPVRSESGRAGSNRVQTWVFAEGRKFGGRWRRG